MLGIATPYERLPYFYSDQYDLGMEYSGHATAWDQVVFRGDPATRAFIAFWLKDQLPTTSPTYATSAVST
jgi:3-phenylpropionate/trans-cinnamate dioxygenase ferredoxin reductase component